MLLTDHSTVEPLLGEPEIVLRAGLTGGIGSGKSTVAQMFRSLGCPTLDLDVVSKEVTRPGQPLVDVIAHQFGMEMITQHGELDRARLASLVFADAQARSHLEQILHPAIMAAASEWARAQSSKPEPSAVVMLEIPLLFEAGLNSSVDRVVLVAADPSIRIERLNQERGMTTEQAHARMSMQLPDSAKRERSHYLIENNGSVEELQLQVKHTWDRLLSDALAIESA